MITIGVDKVVCTCGEDMRRTGGVFGGAVMSDTYYCSNCKKHVVVVTPKEEEQVDFALRMEDLRR